MKKNAILLLSLIALAACNNNEKEIRHTAQGYLEAMGKYCPAEARPFATPQTCNITLDFFEKVVAQTDPEVYADNMPATFTIQDIAIDDSLAEVSYHKSTPSKEYDGILHCVQRDGRWLVNEVLNIPPIMRAAVDTAIAGKVIDSASINSMRRISPQHPLADSGR